MYIILTRAHAYIYIIIIRLMSIEDAVVNICNGKVKPNSAMVMIHFLVRHSFLNEKGKFSFYFIFLIIVFNYP